MKEFLRLEEVAERLMTDPPAVQLRTVLRRNGKSMSWLAKKVGVGTPYLSQVLKALEGRAVGRDGRPVSTEVAEKIFEITGVDLRR